MKKVVILWHNGGRLANQLWLAISAYAYCLDRGYRYENHCFFEYTDQFGMRSGNLFIDLLYYHPYRFVRKYFPALLRDQHSNLFRKYYKLYVKTIGLLRRDAVIFARDDGKGLVRYLPPSVNSDAGVVSFEKTRKKTLYLEGWLFRNPKGIEVYRNEIVNFFRPNKSIMRSVEKTLAPLRENYESVVGVHIRKGDYRSEAFAKSFLFDDKEVSTILNQYLSASGKDKEKICFLICSDGPIDISSFNGLHVAISKGNATHDLFALAAADGIIGSDSTFGAFASYYGNIPFIVLRKEGIDWDYYKDKQGYFENKYCTMVHY